MRIAAFVMLLVSALAAPAQEASFGTQIHVTAIELSAEVVDAAGNTPSDLQPSDFVVVEEGVEYPVTAIDYSDLPETRTANAPAPAAADEPKREWRTLIYVDLELSSRATIRDALASLSAQAERLVSLGTVDVVVANPAARQVVSTSDPAALVAALKQIARITPQDRITHLRRDYLDDDRSRDAITKMRGTAPRQLGLPSEYMRATDVLAKTRTFVEQEQGLIGNLYTRVLRWTARYPRRFPSALMFVSDGFALDPVAFYGEQMNGAEDAATLRESLSKRAAAVHEGFARELAAAGWTFYGMRGGVTANFGSDVTARNHTSHGGEVIVAGSSEPLQELANATGGSVESDPRKFALTIDRMRNRVRFTYQVSRPADGVPRRVEVRARRAGLEVHAPRWAASSSSDASAAARAGNLLDGLDERGELPVEATFQVEGDQRKLTSGALAVRASFKPLAAVLPQLTDATVRVTVAVAIENGPPVVAHKLLRNVNLGKADNISVKVPLRTNKTKKIVVLVEELSTAVWGGTVVRLQ